MSTGARVDESTDEALSAKQHSTYRRIVGQLLWMSPVRPDLSYAIKELSKACQAPHVSHETAAKRVLRYLNGTRDYILELKLNTNLGEDQLLITTDASWASNPADRRSTTGYTIQLQGFLVCASSRTQAVIALSSAEAELMALSSALQDGLFCKRLLSELGDAVKITLHSDSTAALALTRRRGVGRVKHLDIRWLWCQDIYRSGQLALCHVPSKTNLADVLTKGLPGARHHELSLALGVQKQEEPVTALEDGSSPAQPAEEVNVIDSSSTLPTLPFFAPRWSEVAQLFVPQPTELATISAAIQVASYFNEFSKLQETAQRHLQGKAKSRTKRPTESQCRLPCPACLEQCPIAQEDEEQLGLLHLVNCSGAHIHHSVIYKAPSTSSST